MFGWARLAPNREIARSIHCSCVPVTDDDLIFRPKNMPTVLTGSLQVAVHGTPPRRAFHAKADEVQRAYNSSMRRYALVLLLPMLAACGTHHGHDAQSGGGGPLYSPNGEPLSGGSLGHPSCEVALSGWFDRIDVEADGKIDVAAFLADARRQFLTMDLDHDGVVTPAELAEYREKSGSESRTAATTAPDEEVGNTDQDPRNGGGRARRRRSGESGGDSSLRDLGLDHPDPVMLADVDLRNRVSLADFLAYETRNFVTLDTNHDGRLSKDEVTRSCRKP